MSGGRSWLKNALMAKVRERVDMIDAVASSSLPCKDLGVCVDRGMGESE